MSDAEQTVDIKVEDIIEARLEESEALPEHNLSYVFIVFSAKTRGASSNNGKGWVYCNFFQWRKKLVS